MGSSCHYGIASSSYSVDGLKRPTGNITASLANVELYKSVGSTTVRPTLCHTSSLCDKPCLPSTVLYQARSSVLTVFSGKQAWAISLRHVSANAWYNHSLSELKALHLAKQPRITAVCREVGWYDHAGRSCCFGEGL